jgi:hypothetical protein
MVRLGDVRFFFLWVGRQAGEKRGLAEMGARIRTMCE